MMTMVSLSDLAGMLVVDTETGTVVSAQGLKLVDGNDINGDFLESEIIDIAEDKGYSIYANI